MGFPPKPKTEPVADAEPEDEQAAEIEQVVAWRLHVLADEARYPLDLAQVIARRPDIDLHDATDLIAEGCSHRMAGEILL